jgi:hypothetical protein
VLQLSFWFDRSFIVVQPYKQLTIQQEYTNLFNFNDFFFVSFNFLPSLFVIWRIFVTLKNESNESLFKHSFSVNYYATIVAILLIQKSRSYGNEIIGNKHFNSRPGQGNCDTFTVFTLPQGLDLGQTSANNRNGLRFSDL